MDQHAEFGASVLLAAVRWLFPVGLFFLVPFTDRPTPAVTPAWQAGCFVIALPPSSPWPHRQQPSQQAKPRVLAHYLCYSFVLLFGFIDFGYQVVDYSGGIYQERRYFLLL